MPFYRYGANTFSGIPTIEHLPKRFNATTKQELFESDDQVSSPFKGYILDIYPGAVQTGPRV